MLQELLQNICSVSEGEDSALSEWTAEIDVEDEEVAENRHISCNTRKDRLDFVQKVYQQFKIVISETRGYIDTLLASSYFAGLVELWSVLMNYLVLKEKCRYYRIICILIILITSIIRCIPSVWSGKMDWHQIFKVRSLISCMMISVT